MIANQNAGQKPVTENPGTIYDANITNKALIMRENIPSVKIFSGSVSKKTIGFMNTLIRPSTTARTRAPMGVIITPGIKYAVITIAIAEIIQCSSFIGVVISY